MKFACLKCHKAIAYKQGTCPNCGYVEFTERELFAWLVILIVWLVILTVCFFGLLFDFLHL